MSRDILWEVDGWVGGAVDADGVDWIVHNPVTGWFDTLEIRSSDSEKPGADGSYSDPNLYASRVISLSGHARCPDEETADRARDQFNALLADRQMHWLKVTEPVKTLGAMVKLGAGTKLSPWDAVSFDFQLILVAPDPRKFSDDLQVAISSLADPAPGGMEWGGPAGTTGATWGGPAGTTGAQWQQGSGSTGVMRLTNDGTAEAPVRFLVDGAVTGASIVDLTYGRVITYGATIPVGSQLTIDTGSRSALLDGVNRGPLLTRVDWITIPPRSSIEVTFQASSNSPNANLAAQWRHAYL